MDYSDPLIEGYKDTSTRNQRLATHLRAMDLNVQNVPDANDPSKIGHLFVSTGELPRCIGSPVKRPEIGEVIPAPESLGDNVINFPTVL